MRLNFDIQQIETMSEGVVLLDNRAAVKAYNSAARAWLPECLGLTSSLQALITSEQAGRLLFPVAVSLQGTWGEQAPGKVDAWLCKDGRWNYALFIARPTLAQEFKSSETRFVSLIGAEARQEMALLAELLRSRGDRDAILVQSARVERLLIEIDQLVALFQRDGLFLADRLSLRDLLKEILPGLPRQRGESAISYKLVEAANSLGTVYGDAAWLGYAFRQLLAELGASAPARAQVVLRLRQFGDFIFISGNVQSSPGSRHAPGRAGAQDSNAPMVRDIRLQMSRRIIELHGGHLKLIDADSGKGIESFTLDLLTGMPEAEHRRTSCAECPHVLQSYSYAEDISSLLSQQN